VTIDALNHNYCLQTVFVKYKGEFAEIRSTGLRKIPSDGSITRLLDMRYENKKQRGNHGEQKK